MKSVFISYGHKDYSTLADRIYDSLSAVVDENGERKYRLLKDSRGGIRSAHNWDSELEDCIRSADFILYLMEAHSVRRDSVCLDELAFARNQGTINIVPVRLEHTDTPLIVCRLQWIDWQNHELDYENGIAQICSAIDHYEEKISVGVGSLFNYLYKAEYNYVQDRIVGRKSMVEEIERYIEGDDSDVFVISGVAGTGKSALISELSKNVGLVKAVHRCSFDCAYTLNPRDVLCNLAYFLACSNREYAEEVVYEPLEKIGEWDLAEIFENLFVRHLRNEKDKYALVIDALDEMPKDDCQKLLNVLIANSSRLGNVKIIVSVRSESRFDNLIKGSAGIVLDEESNRAAVTEYVEDGLSRRGISSEALKERLLQASEGNFLYLTYLFNEYDRGRVDIESAELPPSLSRLYYVSLTRRFPDADAFYDAYSDILRVLCAAAEPVGREDLAALLGLGKRELLKKVGELRYIVKVEGGRVSVYHRSMKEFLTDCDACGDYYIDRDEGHGFLAEQADKSANNTYLKKYLVYHALACGASGLLAELCREKKDFAEEGMAVAIKTMDEADYNKAIDSVSELPDGGSLLSGAAGVILREREITALLRFMECAKGSYPFVYHKVRGECFYYSDRIEESRAEFTRAFDIATRSNEEQPTYESRRDLSISYSNLAVIAIKKDDIAEAKKLYHLALAIREGNAKQFPSYQSRHDLSVSYNSLADIAHQEDDIAEAKRLYHLALAICEENAKQFPSYESRRDLSVSYNKLADIALQEDDIAEAKRLYRLALAIAEENAKQFPSYESRRDLSVSYERLAGIARKEDDIVEAKRLYRLALAIDEENAKQFPSYLSRQDLAAGYNKLAGMAYEEDDIAEAKRLCHSALAIDEVVYCAVCRAEISRTKKTTEMIAHTPGEAVKENEVPATCAKEGWYDEVVYCTVCRAEISRTKKTTEMIAHTPGEAVKENEVPATCAKEGGYDEVVYCTVCRAELSRTKKMTEMIAHTPGKAVKENEVPATCAKEGGYDEVVYCTVCRAELSRTKKTTEMIAHTPGKAVKENEVPATCAKEGGYDEVVYCTVCRAELSRTKKTTEMIAHTPGAAVKENEVPATCAKKGSCDEVVYCTVCRAELSRTKKTTEMIAHTPGKAVKENEVPRDGVTPAHWEEAVYCTVCGAELSRETRTEQITVKRGDVDGDGEVSSADARLTLRASVRLEKFTDAQKEIADADRNGAIEAGDARLILRASVGLEKLV